MSQLNAALISIDDISIPEISLRNVKTESDAFQNLVESVYNNGVIQTITVVKDPTKEGKYVLEDGKHRLTASIHARDLAKNSKDKNALERVKFIPARIQEHSIEEIPFYQIQANLHRVETTPVEFARQVKRIWATPKFMAMSKSQLFNALGLKKSLAWFDQQLGLGNLCEEAEQLLNEDKISISTAYQLAKLPIEEQLLWLDRAQTDKVDDFTNAVNTRINEIKEQKKGEKKERDPLDEIKPRKKTEFRNKLIEITNSLNNDPENDVLKSFAQGILWGCQMDEETQKLKAEKENAEKSKREQILKMRRDKLLEIQKAAKPKIEAEIRAELGLSN